MPGQQTSEGWELRFKPRGLGRFVGAAFLSLWLCGWAAGEVFALSVLVTGAAALVTGRPAMGGEEPLALGPALAVGSFLAVWLAFWTLGGVMAIRELLRALWAEDRLTLRQDTLMLARRLGPFVSRRRFSRTQTRRVFVQRHDSALKVETDEAAFVLTDLGTPEERTGAATLLHAALGLPEEDASAAPATIPDGWEETTVPREGRFLVPDLKTRGRQATVLSIVALAAAGVTLLLARESLRNPSLWALTAMACAATAGLGWGALWLHRGRKEWRIGRGKLILQKRFGSRVTVLGEAWTLELTESKDSDGDRWYELEAVGPGAPDPQPAGGEIPPLSRGPTGSRRFSITRVIHDPTEPRRLGLWLARRAEMPFVDQVPDEAARHEEEARLREALARSGKLGRLAARLLDRAGSHKDHHQGR